MNVPKFLDLKDESLIYNEENKELQFFVPDNYFEKGNKRSIASIVGEYVSMLGICEYCFVDSKGKRSEFKPFCFPTMMLCKPSSIEKVKAFKTRANSEESDYRILHFKKGDEVVSQTRVPEIIDNVELFFKLALITAKIPNSISYHTLWKIFLDNIEANGNDYGLNYQLFGMLSSEVCRDPKDISRPFRMTSMKDMNGYKTLSVKLNPKYVSPYTALISENFDEGLMSGVLLSDKDEKDIPYSPLEKIVTM